MMKFVKSALVMVCVLCGGVFTVAFGATNIVLDAGSTGRTFEGIGALSAGASSRLLADYPKRQKKEILNLLFKPNYGAALHHLKVEIGGDVNSTDGCEPSHMHVRDSEDYSRGYEWWLMKEAKKRNPKIMLDCLEWGTPAWIGDGKFYSQDNADYIVKFIKGNKRVHSLDIDYVGIWNERAYDIPWIKLLRRTLDDNNLKQVQIVAADEINAWKIADDIAADPELAKAVQVVGTHYAGFKSTPVAMKLDKPIWANEDGPWDGSWRGAQQLARLYNRNYVIGRMTKTIIWSLISSYYDILPLPGSGLMKANTPWSGYYDVQSGIWVTAHTTQFAQPGWKYLDSGCVLVEGGSVVTLMSPTGKDYSVIIETMDAKIPQQIEFKIAGGVPENQLYVWRTNAKEQFVRVEDIKPVNGVFAITADPESVYSLTTTSGQKKGITEPPRNDPFPVTYNDDFESYETGATARYSSEQAGIFEVVKRADGKGQALRQVVPKKGIEWQPNPYPETLLGSVQWEDYSVSADVLIEQAGFVSLFGHVTNIKQDTNPPQGYWLKVYDAGKWELSVTLWADAPDKKGKVSVTTNLITGNVPFSTDTWHNLQLQFSGNAIKVTIDGNQVGKAEDKTWATGMAGIGCGWHGAQFDNLSIQVIPSPVNLALGKVATASSQWSSDYAAGKASDGDGATRWNAQHGKTAGEWVEIDLGGKTSFNGTLLRQFENRITAYKIQYWDENQWKDAYTGGIMKTVQNDSFPKVNAAKIRLLVLDTKDRETPSVLELEVFCRE